MIFTSMIAVIAEEYGVVVISRRGIEYRPGWLGEKHT
jgi:hypothetical protein